MITIGYYIAKPGFTNSLYGGEHVVYLDKSNIYPYPREGIVIAVVSERHALVNGKVMYIWDLFVSDRCNEFIQHWEDVIEARMNEMSELLKEVRKKK